MEFIPGRQLHMVSRMMPEQEKGIALIPSCREDVKTK